MSTAFSITPLWHTGERGGINSGVIFAICTGWPESDEWKNVYQSCVDQNWQVDGYTHFQVIALMADTDRVIELFDEAIAGATTFVGYDISRLMRPIIYRIRTDDELAARLVARLVTHPTTNEKASIPRLLAASRGLTAKIRSWCTDEVNRQRDPAFFAEIGLDVLTGDLRPVTQCLLDVL